MDRLTDILWGETSTPNTLWLLVWQGYGGHPMGENQDALLEISPSLSASARRYYLCTGSFEVAAPGIEQPAFLEPPTFWWPEDHAWFVSTDIDSTSTYVGGGSALIERLVADDALEVSPADLDDNLNGGPPWGPAEG